MYVQRVTVGESLSEFRTPSNNYGHFSRYVPVLDYFTTLRRMAFLVTFPTELDCSKITTVRYAHDTQLAVTGPRNRLGEMSKCLETLLDTMVTWFTSTRYADTC